MPIPEFEYTIIQKSKKNFDSKNESQKFKHNHSHVCSSKKHKSHISISTLYSTNSDVQDCKNRLKVYIPQGYPPYACFYLIRIASDITIAQVLEKLTLHMGYATKKYCLRLENVDGKSNIIENWKKASSFIKVKLYLDNIEYC